MSKHLIAGRFGANDGPSINAPQSEKVTLLDLFTDTGRLSLGIGKALDDLKAINIFPSEVGIDIMVFAAHVYSADTRINRNSESEDNWTREIRLIVPVSNLERWHSCSMLLERQLNFLTGDLWKVEFRSRPRYASNLMLPREGAYVWPPYDALNLFSGGLDSLLTVS